jgi:hypothetical protein
MTSRSLYHLSLNTGNVARTTRGAVDQKVIDHLLPLIDNEEGAFRGLDMEFDLYRPRDLQNDKAPIDGGAIFRIGPDAKSPMPYVICFACWKQDMAEETWEQARDAYEQFKPMLEAMNFWQPMERTHPPVPYLAVILLPTLIVLDPDRLMMMGDMERCLFWALAEGNAS